MNFSSWLGGSKIWFFKYIFILSFCLEVNYNYHNHIVSAGNMPLPSSSWMRSTRLDLQDWREALEVGL